MLFTSQATSWSSAVMPVTGTPSPFSAAKSSIGTAVPSVSARPAGAKRKAPPCPVPTTSTSMDGNPLWNSLRSARSRADRLSVIRMTLAGMPAAPAACFARSSAWPSPLRGSVVAGMMSGSSGCRNRSKKLSSRVSGITRWAVLA
ncbi:hypothetical protein D3C76_897720 [compost metagenome]